MKSLFAALTLLTVTFLSAEDSSSLPEASCPPEPCCPPSPAFSPVPLTCCPQRYNFCDYVLDIYGECLFLQPNGSNLYYAVEAFPFNTSFATPAASPNWQVFEFSPSYHPGFEIGAQLLFLNTDMNLALNWERLHGDDSESQGIALSGNMIGPIFDIGPNSAAYANVNANANFEFDTVNVLLGKKVCFFNDLSTQFYAGAAFARIKQTIQSTYSNAAGTISRSIENPSTFTGAGTEFGVNFDYRIYCDFFFTGSSSISLIMGQLENQTTYQSRSPQIAVIGNPQPNIQTTTVPDRSQLVPGFNEKMGFSYVASFDSFRLTFGAGYQFQIYLNAVQSIDMVSQVLPALTTITPDVGVFAVAFQRTLSNFILTGPYISLFIDF